MDPRDRDAEPDMSELEEDRPEEIDDMTPELPGDDESITPDDPPAPGVGDAFRGGS